MRFKINKLPEDMVIEMGATFSIDMGDVDLPDYNFHPPENELEEYDKYMCELMEGIFSPVPGITEEQVRAFLLSKGFEEAK